MIIEIVSFSKSEAKCQEYANRGIKKQIDAGNMTEEDATYIKMFVEHPEFSKAIEEIRNEVDDRVENALLKSALGYSFHETKLVKAGTDEDAQVLQAVTVEKHQPPSVSSQKFWLENRRSESWKEKQEVEQTGNVTVVFEEGDDEAL